MRTLGKKYILPGIVLAQFLSTSMWFATNAVLDDIKIAFGLQDAALGYLTSAVQFGFIGGTLIFAFLTIADRYSPSRVFFTCSMMGALFNLGVLWTGNTLLTLLLLRILTGICLAGVYPVGMKLAADHFEQGLGKSLGYLVGALVLGTALPHLLNFTAGWQQLPWRSVIVAISFLASAGALFTLVFIPDGPYRRSNSAFKPSGVIKVFRHKNFRAAALGYFGHMWELYAFWAFIPVILIGILKIEGVKNSFWAFVIIALGGLACVLGGYLAQHYGSKKIATTALFLSGFCCLLSPLIFQSNSHALVLTFLGIWSMAVIADSPQWSALVAKNAIPEFRGSALTMVNCIGFSITIISIQLLTLLIPLLPTAFLLFPLALGPVTGLFFLCNTRTSKGKDSP